MKVSRLTLLLLLAYLFSCKSVSAQCQTIKLDDTSYTILNEKIKYSIVLMACSKCSPIRNIGERVIVQFTEREKNVFKKFSKKDWLDLLNCDKSDFAANIMLYYLNKKEAIILSRHNNVKEWRKYTKEEDLAYWRQKLK